MDQHIAWDERYTSTYNAPKVSAGILVWTRMTITGLIMVISIL
jgi:hypothetical protein